MKNIVYRIVYNNLQNYDTTFANFTWEAWCQKNDCILVTQNASTYSEGVKNVFSYLDNNGIEYNKIFIIDATAVVKWNCPNIFNMVDDRLVGWRDMGDLKSIYNRVQKQDLTKYINYGSIIVNSKHRDLITNLPNTESVIEFESELNNALESVDINLDIPKDFNLNYILQYDWLSHNWQDGNDKTPFFIKYAFIWRMDNMDSKMYNQLTNQFQQILREQYTL